VATTCTSNRSSPPKSDEVYGLENPKYQLYMSMQECNKEI
jgi:hypothetical protein